MNHGRLSTASGFFDSLLGAGANKTEVPILTPLRMERDEYAGSLEPKSA